MLFLWLPPPFNTVASSNSWYDRSSPRSKFLFHMEKAILNVGESLQDGEWIEFETTPYGAYPKVSLGTGIRPIGALPQHFMLLDWDSKDYLTTRPYLPNDETSSSRRRRRLTSNALVTYNPDHQTAVIRVEGKPKCAMSTVDNCGGVLGTFDVAYAPPPSPPPPRHRCRRHRRLSRLRARYPRLHHAASLQISTCRSQGQSWARFRPAASVTQ